jgi:hypothetical protein
VRLIDPVVVHDEARGPVPRPVRAVLRLANVSDFMLLTQPE